MKKILGILAGIVAIVATLLGGTWEIAKVSMESQLRSKDGEIQRLNEQFKSKDTGSQTVSEQLTRLRQELAQATAQAEVARRQLAACDEERASLAAFRSVTKEHLDRDVHHESSGVLWLE